MADRILWMRETHTSKVAGHFGITNTLQNLQTYVYWPRMQQDVARFMRGCTLCSISKPSNRKLGLYMPLPVPTRPWESISIDLLVDCPKWEEVTIIFSWSLIDFLRWWSLCHARSQSWERKPHGFFFNMCGYTLVFLHQLSLIGIADFLVAFGDLCGTWWTLSYKEAPPFIYKLTAKSRWWTALWYISWEATTQDIQRYGMRIFPIYSLLSIG